MTTFWAVGEIANGQPTQLSRELATVARDLAGKSGGDAVSVLIGRGAAGAAKELAGFGPNVIAAEADTAGSPAPNVIAPILAALVEDRMPDYVLIGASNDGKDIAGYLHGTNSLMHGMTGLPVLVNVAGVTWADDGLQVEMSTFGGRLVTRSTFTAKRGIVLVRPASAVAELAKSSGSIESVKVKGEPAPPVKLVESVKQEGAAASIEEARIIVGGGRGVGTPEGFKLIEELAQALGGVVGATRAVVDAGWIGYGHQIGQTGKTVKPALYLACGISGAIQHKVGVQTAGTIVAINRDPDAAIAEFADLMVVGDLFDIVPKLTEAIRARKTG